VIAGWLESALNRALALDPDAARRIGELDGRVLLLELDNGGDAPLRFYIVPSATGVSLRREHDGVPDVTIAGTPSVFLRQLRRGPTVSGELTIRGDIELGQRFQRLLSSFRPDWEEGLAGMLGDVPAHQVARTLRAVGVWGAAAVRTLGADASEYLKEEAMVLAKRDRVEKFLRDVDRLRADADRLEKRVQRLTGNR
jgi:ubiquinone biosynthesis accessory factor UbiJ